MADRNLALGGSSRLAAAQAMNLPCKLLSFVIDFSKLTHQSGDVITLANLPAGTVLLGGSINVVTPGVDAGTITAALGYTGAATALGAATDVKTAGKTWTGSDAGILVDDAGTDVLLVTLAGTAAGDLSGKVQFGVLAVDTTGGV